MEYHGLRQHPKLKHIWETFYNNEMGRLWQGVCRGDKGPERQRVAGLDTFRVVKIFDITHAGVKAMPSSELYAKSAHRRKIPTGLRSMLPVSISLPTMTLTHQSHRSGPAYYNSVLLQLDAKFACFDAADFYPQKPMTCPEYVRIKCTDIPEEF